MKFNVFFKVNHGAHWVLSDDSQLFKSPLFKTRPDAIDDIEAFITLMQSPEIIDSDEFVGSKEVKITQSAFFVIKQEESRWLWEILISTNGKLSKIAECAGKGFDSLEQARQKAKSFCESIVKAPILDQANVAIPGLHFSNSFESEYQIKDIHPSSKWIK